MKLAHLLLESKGRYVCSIAPDSSVYDAISLLTRQEAGVAMVLVDKKLVGLVSERELATKVNLVGRAF